MSEIRTGIDPFIEPSFSLSNRLARFLWGIVYILLFRTSPRSFYAWRALLLKLFGAKLGRHCHVYPKTKIWAPWNLVMEDYSSMGDNVDCYSMAKVTIGKKAIVSQESFICTGSHDYTDEKHQLYAKPIVIGKSAWICAQSFLSPGVNIGEGAVIGARSVVTKNMPAWTVCAGNPCNPIKSRILKNK